MEVYLDNSATTRQYDEVTDKMALVMKEAYGNPSSLHRKGLDAEKHIKESRKDLACMIGADSNEIFFTSCGTESDNTVLFGTAQAKRRSGKRIITTKIEHPAILEPAKKLEEMGFEIVYLDVDKNCQINLKQLRDSLTEDTMLISVMAVNNETGAILPIKEIAQIKDEFNQRNGSKVWLHTDAVQALGKIDCNVKGAFKGVDFISASAHKIHGPKGMGFIYARKGLNIKPLILGGGQESHFRSGTENVPGIVGFGLAGKLAQENFEKRIRNMSMAREYLLKGITSQLDDVLINTPQENSCPSVVNMSFLGTRGEVILHSLEQEGIYVSTGSACSSNKNKKGSHVLEAMGLSFDEIEGAIRFSFSEFNTIQEMDYTIDKVVKAVTRFRKLGDFTRRKR